MEISLARRFRMALSSLVETSPKTLLMACATAALVSSAVVALAMSKDLPEGWGDMIGAAIGAALAVMGADYLQSRRESRTRTEIATAVWSSLYTLESQLTESAGALRRISEFGYLDGANEAIFELGELVKHIERDARLLPKTEALVSHMPNLQSRLGLLAHVLEETLDTLRGRIGEIQNSISAPEEKTSNMREHFMRLRIKRLPSDLKSLRTMLADVQSECDRHQT